MSDTSEHPTVNVNKTADDSSDDESESLQYKLVILGDGAVGKTSTIQRFTQDSFNTSYKQTIGVDFFLRRLTLPNAKSTNVTLQLWDIGGQTIASSMLPNYIFGAHCVCIIYDITNMESFLSATQDWYNLVKKAFSDNHVPFQSGRNSNNSADDTSSPQLPLIALIGNKFDLQHMRAVSADKHNKFVTENCLHSYFISAATGDSISTCFTKIAALLSNVNLTEKELETQVKVQTAQIIQYTENDKAETPEQEQKSLQNLTKQIDKKKCTIM